MSFYLLASLCPSNKAAHLQSGHQLAMIMLPLIVSMCNPALISEPHNSQLPWTLLEWKEATQSSNGEHKYEYKIMLMGRLLDQHVRNSLHHCPWGLVCFGIANFSSHLVFNRIVGWLLFYSLVSEFRILSQCQIQNISCGYLISKIIYLNFPSKWQHGMLRN